MQRRDRASPIWMPVPVTVRPCGSVKSQERSEKEIHPASGQAGPLVALGALGALSAAVSTTGANGYGARCGCAGAVTPLWNGWASAEEKREEMTAELGVPARSTSSRPAHRRLFERRVRNGFGGRRRGRVKEWMREACAGEGGKKKKNAGCIPPSRICNTNSASSQPCSRTRGGQQVRLYFGSTGELKKRCILGAHKVVIEKGAFVRMKLEGGEES
ncbi:hypothetical protein DFH09DRAFT_1081553 [Mycena vulgaris]|nr:hypothetical protein DFH09DRAFT_1081553 [Mycena vulgaris]